MSQINTPRRARKPRLWDLERCHAATDGECNDPERCPQLRDGEPLATGRHCPLDTWEDLS